MDLQSLPKEDIEEVIKLARKRQVPIQQAAIQAFQQTGYCMTRGCDSSDYFEHHENGTPETLRTKRELKAFQKCHTLPRAAQLKAIAKNNHAIWIPMRPAEMMSTKPIYSTESIKKVLTFTGFCNSCDNRLFKPIDSAIPRLDEQNTFLLAYRAFCYKAWRNEVDANAHLLTIENAKELAIKEGTFDVGVYEETHNSARADHLRQKRINIQIANLFQNGIENCFYQRLKSVAFTLNSRLQFRYSCATPMTLDLLNRSNPISWGDCILDPIAFVNLIDIGGKDTLLVSWFDYIPDEISQKYLDVIRYVDSQDAVADVLTQFAVLNNCGFAANPDWVNSWPIEAKARLTKPIIQQVYQGDRPDEITMEANGWFGRCSIEKEEVISNKTADLTTVAMSNFQVAMLDNELCFEPSEVDRNHLPAIAAKKIDENYTLIENHEYQSGLKTAAESLRVAQRAGFGSDLIPIRLEAWKAFGTTLLHCGCPELAALAYKVVKSDYQSIDNLNGPYADLLARLQTAHKCCGQIHLAILVGNKAIDLHEKLLHAEGEKKRLIDLLNVMSNQMTIYADRGETLNGLGIGQRCLNHLEGLESGTDIEIIEVRARILNNFAILYENSGDLASALDVAREAFGLYATLAKTHPERFIHEFNGFGFSCVNLLKKIEILGVSTDSLSNHQLRWSSANDLKKNRNKT